MSAPSQSRHPRHWRPVWDTGVLPVVMPTRRHANKAWTHMLWAPYVACLLFDGFSGSLPLTPVISFYYLEHFTPIEWRGPQFASRSVYWGPISLWKWSAGIAVITSRSWPGPEPSCHAAVHALLLCGLLALRTVKYPIDLHKTISVMRNRNWNQKWIFTNILAFSELGAWIWS